MGKVILVDTSGLFVPTVKVVDRLRMEKAKKGGNGFILPPRAMYFNSLLSCLSKIGVDKEDIVIMALEGKSFRKTYDANYKAQRQGLRDADKFTDWTHEFKELNRLHDELNEATNWHFVRVANGLEADDIIAIACRYFKDKECIVVTGDKDLYQLAYYPNVKLFSTNKKCKGSKGCYDFCEKPLKVIADKARLGDKSDNILVDKENDTVEDYEHRYFLVNLLELPKDIEEKGINALENLPEKELNLDKLPNFKNVQEKFLKIYKKDKVITPEYCYKLLEKRKERKKKK